MLLVSTSASAAYTSLTVERDAQIDVVAYDNGIVKLSPGTVSFVTLANDQLAIDTTNGGAGGVNVNSNLLMGDPANPTSAFAFSVLNNDNEQRTMNLSYVTNQCIGTNNVVFQVYDSTGSQDSTFANGEEITLI